jgi:hypothetical protein
MKGSNKMNITVCLVLGVVVIGAVLFKYNKSKFGLFDGFNSKQPTYSSVSPESVPLDNLTSVETSDSSPSVTSPQDLLPKKVGLDVNADLKNINLLNAGANYGINTVGSSLRNPNLQLRSEPIIQKTATGPWNNTTIDPDTTRRALEIDGSE